MRLATHPHHSDEANGSSKQHHEKPRLREAKTPHENDHGNQSAHDSSTSAQYLALTARATNDAVRDWDVRTGELRWPQGLESLLGYPANNGACQIAFWQQQIHPADQAHVAASIRDALAGSIDHWCGEYRFRRADGEYAYLLERALIVRDSQQRATRLIGSMMDITARKQLQEQLSRSQRMEAFGQLAGGVAHDFNNFLTTILGYSDLLLHELGVKGPLANHIGEIRDAAGRASTLTTQLLAFSRKQPLEPRVLEVNSLIINLERSLLRLLGDNISVVSHLHHLKDGAHIKVDPGQFTQIILNLAVNARDAMPKGGRLTIETSVVTVTAHEEADAGFGELGPGEYVVLSLADTGVGMSDEVKAHLFEPFFTTKGHVQSSGLGLATTYGIVRQSGGHICIDSKVDKGTTIKIFLPKQSAPAQPSYRKPSLKRLPLGNETVLVLEDDVSVRHISVRVLRNLGYQVLEAANGDDAQRLIQKLDGNLDLLLTDMVMPQMSGRHFADWLRKTSPNTKVVFVSGYLEESLHPGDRRDPDMFFLAKPFDPEQLAQKVREALDTKHQG